MCVCVCVCVCEREREKEHLRERQRERGGYEMGRIKENREGGGESEGEG